MRNIHRTRKDISLNKGGPCQRSDIQAVIYTFSFLNSYHTFYQKLLTLPTSIHIIIVMNYPLSDFIDY